MTRVLWISLIALCLAGCGHRGFKKDGATYDDYMQDLRQCVYEDPQYRCNSRNGLCVREDDRNTCMVQKGWRITLEDGRFIPR